MVLEESVKRIKMCNALMNRCLDFEHGEIDLMQLIVVFFGLVLEYYGGNKK